MLQWFRSLAAEIFATGRKQWCRLEWTCTRPRRCMRVWKGHGAILLALAAGTGGFIDERRPKWTEEFSSPRFVPIRMIGEFFAASWLARTRLICKSSRPRRLIHPRQIPFHARRAKERTARLSREENFEQRNLQLVERWTSCYSS